MEFNEHKSIYLQICDNLCEQVLSGILKPLDRIPSVRELGAELGVNPNTVARSYEKLTSDGVIFNKRGIGYFICGSAPEKILEVERKKFIEEELPAIKKRIELLGIDIAKYL